MKYADLHVHTHYSDSTFSPEEVIACAKKHDLSAIAISDHDSIDGIEPCMKLGAEAGIEVIPAIELETEKTDTEIHILGYFIDWEKEWFQKRLKEIQTARIGRMREMVKKLKDFNIDIDVEEVFKLAGKGCVGRLHLAQALLKTGKVRNLREIFDNYIGFLKPCYVPNINFSPREAVEVILKVGGVPVMAHPQIIGRDDYIEEFVSYGLRGLEVFHSDHDSKATKHYTELAKKYNLLMTGGSDCHGLGKRRILMGTVKVPYALVEALKKESEKIRHEYR